MPEHNPYAPPQAGIRLPSKTSEAPGWQETTSRVGGWMGLIFALIVLVLFGLSTSFEFRKLSAQEGGFDPWRYREWITRMTAVGLVCMLAAVTSWGLIRLRSWARWTLTVVTVSPFPATFLCFLLFSSSFPNFRKVVDPGEVAIGFAVTCLFYLPILYFLWSPGGRRLFSPGYVSGRGRSGCLPILAAMVFVFAEGVAYTMLVVSSVNLLDAFGLFAS
jgi:hypothetical protein